MKKLILLLIILILCGCSTAPQTENMQTETKTEKTREEWIQTIKDSGVFDSYAQNESFIVYDELDGVYDIKAQAKDIPTISAYQNSDGTFTSLRNYIILKEFTYTKNNEERRAELELHVILNQNMEDPVQCRLYVPDADPSNYSFYYEANDKFIYKNGRNDEMHFTSDLQTKILAHCQIIMDEIAALEPKVHQLMEEILLEKGFETVVWKQDESTNHFSLYECDAVYPLIQTSVDGYENKVIDGYYVVRKGNLYGVINDKWELIVDTVSEYAPVLDHENHLHFRPVVSANVQTEIKGTPFVLCTGGHGGSGFGYAGDDETWSVRKIRYIDAGPSEAIEEDFSFMGELAGAYREAAKFEYWEEYKITIINSYDDGYGIFNKDGMVTGAIYKDAFLTFGELIPVMNDEGLWGYVNAQGEIVIPFKYDAAIHYWNKASASPIINGIIILKDAESDLYGAMDLEGNTVANFCFEFLFIVGETLFGKENGIWWVSNQDGWVVYNGD